MTVNRRKKAVRYRGQKTHGCGAKKKRRGAGNRGGKGMAGSGKRADQKKTYVLKYFGTDYFGKKGFRSHKRKLKTINIGLINEHLDQWVKKGWAKDDKNIYIIDLTKLGYDKLLGKGLVTKKYKINVEFASQKTISKIKGAGGEISVNNVTEEVE